MVRRDRPPESDTKPNHHDEKYQKKMRENLKVDSTAAMGMTKRRKWTFRTRFEKAFE